MFVVEHTLETTALPERVWACWLNPETWPGWQDGLAWAYLAGPMGPGRTGKVRLHSGKEFGFRIESLKAREELVWTLTGFLKQARLVQRLEPSDLGTRLHHTVEVQGLLAWLSPWFRKGRLRLALPASMRKLARVAAEGQP